MGPVAFFPCSSFVLLAYTGTAVLACNLIGNQSVNWGENKESTANDTKHSCTCAHALLGSLCYQKCSHLSLIKIAFQLILLPWLSKPYFSFKRLVIQITRVHQARYTIHCVVPPTNTTIITLSIQVTKKPCVLMKKNVLHPLVVSIYLYSPLFLSCLCSLFSSLQPLSHIQLHNNLYISLWWPTLTCLCSILPIVLMLMVWLTRPKSVVAEARATAWSTDVTLRQAGVQIAVVLLVGFFYNEEAHVAH